jgi:pimeloyl-ACP methyl ester carboxylesterase
VPLIEPDYALLDRAGAAQSSFFPRPDQTPPPANASDHLLEVEPGVNLDARLYEVNPGAPVIIYFHGNGEVIGDHDEVSQLYARIGTNLLVIEFRGYGASDGEPTFATLVTDARAAAKIAHRLLDQRGFSGDRFIMGRSMGAHSALEIAANASERFRGLILESGAGNLKRWAERLTFAPEEAEKLLEMHEAKIRAIRLPVLMLHGEVDELIPLSRAEEMKTMLAATECELVVIHGAGHNDIVWVGYQEYFSALARFVTARSRR